MLDRTGYIAAPGARGHARGRGPAREPARAADGRRGLQRRRTRAPEADDRSGLELFLDQVALVSDLDRLRADAIELRLADDRALRQGPRVPGGLPGRAWRKASSPIAASSRDRERRRGGAAPLLRGHDPRHGAADAHWAAERRRYGSLTFAVPSRFLREIPLEHTQGDSVDAPRASGSRFEGGRESSAAAGRAVLSTTPTTSPERAPTTMVSGRGSG